MNRHPFSVMAKPIGPICNLECRYCYYLEKEDLFQKPHSFKMSDRQLESYIRDYIHSQPTPVVTFAWQGGEPTLLGLDFFRKVVALQKKHRPPSVRIENALQTNGTLLDAEWAAFFRENRFLIGLSIDGTRVIHDKYRVDKRNRGTFDQVIAALRLLRREKVEFNTLTVVHRRNEKFGRQVYRMLRSEGVSHLQFIPLVERCYEDGSLAGAPKQDDGGWQVTGESVSPSGFGRFLCDVFDEWIQADVGRISVQLFDVHLGLWAGFQSALCIHAETCGQGLALEHNGDLYACDHYVYPEYRLGNIADGFIGDLAADDRQRTFGTDKRDQLSGRCRGCAYLAMCNGGCPKHRFMGDKSGRQFRQNYLCPSYREYFTHIDRPMRFMADLVRHNQSPALIMDMIKRGAGRKTAGRVNSPKRPAGR